MQDSQTTGTILCVRTLQAVLHGGYGTPHRLADPQARMCVQRMLFADGMMNTYLATTYPETPTVTLCPDVHLPKAMITL